MAAAAEAGDDGTSCVLIRTMLVTMQVGTSRQTGQGRCAMRMHAPCGVNPLAPDHCRSLAWGLNHKTLSLQPWRT